MGSLSFGHWAIVLLIALLLFGRGRISETMGDFGKGIRSFRKGLTDEGDPAAPARNKEAAISVLPDSESAPVKPE